MLGRSGSVKLASDTDDERAIVKTLKLRKYQTEAIDQLTLAWASGVKRPSVVLPTGMGKTVIFAELIRRTIGEGRRPIVLVHRDELAKQTVKKIEEAAPGVRVGVIKAERHEMVNVDVIVASVQTLGRQARLDRTPSGIADLVIIDECHHASADSYLRILKHFGCFEPSSGAVACGFTATMQRGDEKNLSAVWDKVVYRKDIMYGILHGFLVDVRGKTVKLPTMDLSEVGYSAGDYQEGSLGEALEEAGAPKSTAEAYHEYATRPDGTLRPGILFAPTVASAESFAAEFCSQGIPTEVVTGTTPIEDRELIYKRARAGETKVIASCMVLTEGFDMPEMEVAVIARLTARAGLYIQMVGRVLRPAPWTGKTEALVIDVVGVSERHALASLADLSESKVKPKPDESLAEAKERQDAEAESIKAGKQHRASKTGDVDLFKRSKSAWLQSKGGRWFIPTRVATVFLWEQEDGTFKVGRTKDNYTMKGGSWLVEGSFTLEMAMAWAEQEAADLDPSVSSRSASWRTRSAKPSDAQKGQLAKCRITFDDTMTKAEASDLLSIHYASRLLDPR
jgi:superfamily II DNA or RNA helicase